MDWRNPSRSRSRMDIMEWRQGSRSRSRPPNQWDHGSEFSQALLMGDSFASNGMKGFDINSLDIKPSQQRQNQRSPIPIPIPGSLKPQHQGFGHDDSLLSAQLSFSSNTNSSDSRHPPLSGYNNHNFLHPSSSMPASGFYAPVNPEQGMLRMEQRHVFPKHVRKTSFDHTVSRSGIMGDIGGRHQVNGRPMPPDSSLVSAGRARFGHCADFIFFE